MIYVIESGDYFKVGYTKDETTLEQRRLGYYTHNPDCAFVREYKGSINIERFIHKGLSKHRVRGEWFNKFNDWENQVQALYDVAVKKEETPQPPSPIFKAPDTNCKNPMALLTDKGCRAWFIIWTYVGFLNGRVQNNKLIYLPPTQAAFAARLSLREYKQALEELVHFRFLETTDDSDVFLVPNDMIDDRLYVLPGVTLND